MSEGGEHFLANEREFPWEDYKQSIEENRQANEKLSQAHAELSQAHKKLSQKDEELSQVYGLQANHNQGIYDLNLENHDLKKENTVLNSVVDKASSKSGSLLNTFRRAKTQNNTEE